MKYAVHKAELGPYAIRMLYMKKYAVHKAEIRPYAVYMLKMKKDAVRKRGGVSPSF